VPTDLFVQAKGGIRLAVRDHGGDGRPMLLMHGAGTHLLSVERLARILQPLRVVTMDQRWSGQSGDSDAYSWDDLVSDVEAVIEGLDLENPVVAGHSWGGMIAAFYGVAHPEAPAVINLDGHGPGDPSLYDGLSAEEVEEGLAMIENDMPRLDREMRQTDATEGDDTWKRETHARQQQHLVAMGVPEAAADAFAQRGFKADGPGRWRLRPDPVVLESLRADQKMFDVYRACEVPLLVVLAPAPQAGLPEFAAPLMVAYRRGLARAFDELSRERPSVKVVTLENADHASITRADAPAVAAAMTAFLDEVGYR
jgi:pimeloyl-ACP methyl ester carboxylesterase